MIETGLPIGHPVDAAEDGRAPERRCCFGIFRGYPPSPEISPLDQPKTPEASFR
ncbi:MAG: hypothetical protein GX456_18715 [Verrucomicrobia bacterium]|nr:hypothetical protein [Verrucomicrobiota bacterium]